MVPFAASPDFVSFYIHISQLAQHTHDILADSRVSLMIAEHDAGVADPQTLARVSLQGEASEMAEADADYADAKARYLGRLPEAAFNFTLGDFSLFRVHATSARYVAGFGRIFNLTGEHLKKVAEVRTGTA